MPQNWNRISPALNFTVSAPSEIVRAVSLGLPVSLWCALRVGFSTFTLAAMLKIRPNSFPFLLSFDSFLLHLLG
ncbi:hypothetical protein E2542_SST31482 [Spatholobus suberectus]|nr:hypothetical protein E2542_SST31482 [Spatholobus suberectus]